jgi:methylated-DNA-[protein]-cysteine S-methyltransferase
MNEALRYTSVETPIGRLWVAYDAQGINLTQLNEDEDAFVRHAAEEYHVWLVPDPNPPAELVDALHARLNGNTELTFNLERFTPFQRAVLETVFAIPRGEVRTYGEVALEAGYPGAARAVGEVMRTNRIPVLIPCHRVVRAGGDTGRYTPDPTLKPRMLRAEGVPLDEFRARRRAVMRATEADSESASASA